MKKRGALIVVLLLVCCTLLDGQIITTVIGGGSSSAEGIPATAVVINNPGQTTFDDYGNFYLPQLLGNRVSKVDATGIITTIAGNGIAGSSGDGGPATNALLRFPNTVVVDTAGNIFICDNNNNKIRKINRTTGIITTIAGIGTPGFSGDGGTATNAQLFYPAGICLDKYGNLYISDGNRRVRKVNSSGVISTIAGIGIAGVSGDGGPATASKCGAGVLCMDEIGNLYIADCAVGESRIAKIDTSGIITTFAGTSNNGSYNGENIPATAANINPVGMAFDKFGNLIFADNINNRIRRIDKFGIITTIAGTGTQGYSGDNGPAISASLNRPSGLTIDTCGNIYVSDNDNARIRKITFPKCHFLDVNEHISERTPSVSINPNPVYNSLTITAMEKIKSVRISNAVGQSFDVAHDDKSFGKLTMMVDVSQLPVGLYFVRVNGVWVERFVKE